ncbi:MAG: hypothetical protein QM737_16815 [Ferruginibacter sp.]
MKKIPYEITRKICYKSALLNERNFFRLGRKLVGFTHTKKLKLADKCAQPKCAWLALEEQIVY